MYLESKEIIDHPAERVYPLVRDHIELIVPFMPNIEKIETVQREQPANNRHQLLNHWYGTAHVPRLLSGIIKPEFFAWKDFALWKDEDFCVDYRLEGFWLTDLYRCSGTNYFTPMGQGKTEIKVTCSLEIYPDRVPGIPKILARRAQPAIEGLVRQLLEPNLTSLASGVKRYLDSQSANEGA